MKPVPEDQGLTVEMLVWGGGAQQHRLWDNKIYWWLGPRVQGAVVAEPLDGRSKSQLWPRGCHRPAAAWLQAGFLKRLLAPRGLG